jgi:fructuronate reductase
MPQPQRLSLSALARHPAGTAVTLPLVDPGEISIGIVHFGIGAFHRAHQAVYTEDAAAASGETRWGILGVTGRTDAVARALQPQDCLYGVLEKGADSEALRLIGSVRDVAWPGEDSEKVVAAIGQKTTQLATLTITEKGYRLAADGRIDLGLRVVVHDVELVDRELAGDAGIPASRTPIGLLVRGLARRFRSDGGGFSVLSCDNLAGNGAITRALVLSFVDALGQDGGASARSRDALRDWIEASVRFPSSMVDRITPATTDADRSDALALLGLSDEALVVAEPFSQWVIEDDFGGDRPRWELAGAILTDDVAPYEKVKLRVLNATHSLLAWLGSLLGHGTIAAAVADPRLRDLAERIIDEDILPTLTAPPGIDLARYRDTVLERFANPNLAHTTAQVAMDGSQKLPNRLLGTVVDRVTAGSVPEGLALVVAAWISYIASTMAEGGPVLDDPLADRLRSAVGEPTDLVHAPDAVVDRVFAIEEVFPGVVRGSAEFHAAVVRQIDVVRRLIEE